MSTSCSSLLLSRRLAGGVRQVVARLIESVALPTEASSQSIVGDGVRPPSPTAPTAKNAPRDCLLLLVESARLHHLCLQGYGKPAAPLPPDTYSHSGQQSPLQFSHKRTRFPAAGRTPGSSAASAKSVQSALLPDIRLRRSPASHARCNDSPRSGQFQPLIESIGHSYCS